MVILYHITSAKTVWKRVGSKVKEKGDIGDYKECFLKQPLKRKRNFLWYFHVMLLI